MKRQSDQPGGASGGAAAAAGPRVFRKQAPEDEPVTDDSMCLFRLGELCDHECPMCTNSGLPERRFFDQAELRRRADLLTETTLEQVVGGREDPRAFNFLTSW